MDERARQRRLVEPRHVPDDEHAQPERDRDLRSQQEGEQTTQRSHARERHEQVTWQEEERERPAHRHQRQGDPEIGDQHVLEHVGGLELLLGDRVERRHDADQDDRHACQEERDPGPGRQVRAPAMEPAPAVEEEHDRDRRERQRDRVGRPRAPVAPARREEGMVHAGHGSAAEPRVGSTRARQPTRRSPCVDSTQGAPGSGSVPPRRAAELAALALTPPGSRRPPPCQSGRRPPCACSRRPRCPCTRSGAARSGDAGRRRSG